MSNTVGGGVTVVAHLAECLVWIPNMGTMCANIGCPQRAIAGILLTA